MCMGRNLSKTALKRYQAKGKNGYIRAWKVVKKRCDYYESAFVGRKYKTAFAHARRDASGEQQLIHAFRNKASANAWAWRHADVIVECLVKPKWVIGIGDSQPEKTLTTKAIVMPEFPKTKVAVREFRKAIKDKKVKTYSWE